MNKMFLAAAALATLVASRAFAQSYDPDVGSGNTVGRQTPPGPTAPWAAYQGAQGAQGAYARVPAGRPHVRTAPWAGYQGAQGAYARVAPGSTRLQSAPNAVYDAHGQVIGA